MSGTTRPAQEQGQSVENLGGKINADRDGPKNIQDNVNEENTGKYIFGLPVLIYSYIQF
jgi:hypothetical protein